jgi:acetoin utilization deacetylase AcuC-like enzyme
MDIIYTRLHALHAPQREMHGHTGSVHPAREVPERAERILAELERCRLGHVMQPRAVPRDVLASVHDPDLLTFLSTVYPLWHDRIGQDTPVIPDVFALRSLCHRPADPLVQTGWYCLDRWTPILEGTWEAASWAAGCAWTAAEYLLVGKKLVYALCRPPGHHAGRDYFGGYCYLNNAAIAASCLRSSGSVAILDIDYHHGNGTQDIFYDAADVLYVSLHADPGHAFPFYSGYRDESGTGAGRGTTVNFPLPQDTDEALYLDTLGLAVCEIQRFRPDFLVISFGADTLQADPIGGLGLSPASYPRLAALIGTLHKPAVIIQEGGYCLEQVGPCVATFLQNLSNTLMASG